MELKTLKGHVDSVNTIVMTPVVVELFQHRPIERLKFGALREGVLSHHLVRWFYNRLYHCTKYNDTGLSS
jgi:hypothetical protein